MSLGGSVANDRPEGPSSSYLTRKQLYALLVGASIFLLLFALWYVIMKGQSDKALCRRNLKDAFTAMGLYLSQNDDRYPPVAHQLPNGAPLLLDGKAFTWATLIQGGMSTRRSLVCPSSHEDERARNVFFEDSNATLLTSYGMYMAWSSYEQGKIDAPSRAVLLSETSNHGARDTYNPIPFTDPEDGAIPQDGFAIGWDQGVIEPGEDAQWVTRLAFPGTAGRKFEAEGKGRHDGGLFVLFADGHLGMIRPPEAKIERGTYGLSGYWATR